MELADTADLKSAISNDVRVRVSPRPLKGTNMTTKEFVEVLRNAPCNKTKEEKWGNLITFLLEFNWHLGIENFELKNDLLRLEKAANDVIDDLKKCGYCFQDTPI